MNRLLLLPFALAAVLWIAVLPFPLLTNTGTFAYVADRWSKGDRLYAEIADNKPPGTIVPWRVALAVFGRGKAHVAIELLAQGATLAALVLVTRRFYAGPEADETATRTGVLYAVSVFAVQMPDTIAESETLCLPLVAIAMGVGSVALRKQPVRWWVGAALGAIAGTLVAIKIVPAVIPLAIAGWVVWKTRDHVRTPLAFAAGLVASLAPWVVWMASTGALAPLLDVYARWKTPPAVPWLLAPLGVVIGPLYLIPAGILALLALVRIRRSPPREPGDAIALVAAGAALLAVAAQRKFFVYHFLLALPPLAVLGGRWWQIVRNEPRAHRTAGIALAALLIAGPVLRRNEKLTAFARLATGAESRSAYDARWRVPKTVGGGAFLAGFGAKVPTDPAKDRFLADPVGEKEVAARLRELPAGPVLVWGLDAQILFHADRASASRFPHLLPYARGAFREELLAELRAERPAAVVVQRRLFDPIDLNGPVNAQQLLEGFPELRSWLAEHFILEETLAGFDLYLPR